jgi:hypothetical protein
VDTRAGLDDLEERKLLTLQGLELRSLGSPACSPLLYRLSYPGSLSTQRTDPITSLPIGRRTSLHCQYHSDCCLMDSDTALSCRIPTFRRSMWRQPFPSRSALSFGVGQAVSRWLPTTAAQIQAQGLSCGIYGGRSGTGAGFLRILRLPLTMLIPPIAPQSPSSVV